MFPRNNALIIVLVSSLYLDYFGIKSFKYYISDGLAMTKTPGKWRMSWNSLCVSPGQEDCYYSTESSSLRGLPAGLLYNKSLPADRSKLKYQSQKRAEKADRLTSSTREQHHNKGSVTAKPFSLPNLLLYRQAVAVYFVFQL
jgi:hypothetical protein